MSYLGVYIAYFIISNAPYKSIQGKYFKFIHFIFLSFEVKIKQLDYLNIVFMFILALDSCPPIIQLSS